MSYLTPVEFERILRRVFYEDDIGRNLDYVGGHRFRQKLYNSGSLTVGPATAVSTLSVSGVGFQSGFLRHYSAGVAPTKTFHKFNVDGEGLQYAHRHSFVDVNIAYLSGLTAAGWHIGRVWIKTWDTAANKYDVRCLFLGPLLRFRTSLAGQLYNADTVTSATMVGEISYCLFVSTKRVLCKLPKFIDAPLLRAKAGSKQMIHPLVVESLGYFEDEEEHPYRDYLADIPNEWDTEITLPDGTKSRGASPAKAKVVLSLFVPEDWTAKKALGKIKVSKVLEG